MIEVYVPSVVPPEWREDADREKYMEIAEQLADAARAKWLVLASERLHTSRREYVDAISRVDHSEQGVVAVRLVGTFPNMIEQGFDAFDLRDTLLGPNVPIVDRGGRGKHQSQDGHFYRSIFFRISPGGSGANIQRAGDMHTEYLGEKRSKIMARIAMKKARAQAPTRSNPGEPTQWGGRVSMAGTEFEHVRGRSHVLDKSGLSATATPAGAILRGGPEHKTGLFEGMYRFEQHYKNAVQNYYGTFRTISTSEPDGWIHPGMQPGAKLAEEANAYAIQLVPELLRAL